MTDFDHKQEHEQQRGEAPGRLGRERYLEAVKKFTQEAVGFTAKRLRSN